MSNNNTSKSIPKKSKLYIRKVQESIPKKYLASDGGDCFCYECVDGGLINVRQKYVCFDCKKIWKGNLPVEKSSGVNDYGYKYFYGVVTHHNFDNYDYGSRGMDFSIEKARKIYQKARKEFPVLKSHWDHAGHVHYGDIPDNKKQEILKNLNYRKNNKYYTNVSEIQIPKCSSCGNAGIKVDSNFRHPTSDKEWQRLRDPEELNKLNYCKFKRYHDRRQEYEYSRY